MSEPKILFNRTNQLDKQGRGRVEIRVIINWKPTCFYTKVKVIPEDWDEVSLKVKKRSYLQYTRLNNAIRDLHHKIGQVVEEYQTKGLPLNKEIIDNILFPKQEVLPDPYFIEIMQQDIESRKDLSNDTKRLHRNVLEKLTAFKPYAKSSDVDFKYIQDFEYFLIDKRIGANTRRCRYHACLKSYINRAIQQNYFHTVNPYSKGFKMPHEKVKREALTPAELKRIEDLEFEDELYVLEKVRNMFLFACYTGLRLGDLLIIEKSWITIEGEAMYLTFKPHKKGSRYVNKFPLHELFGGKPKEILLKYYDAANLKFFTKVNEGSINRNLKDVARMASIKKNLHSHIGKITFVTTLANMGVSIDIVSGLTGTTPETLRKYYTKENTELRNITLEKIQWNDGKKD